MARRGARSGFPFDPLREPLIQSWQTLQKASSASTLLADSAVSRVRDFGSIGRARQARHHSPMTRFRTLAALLGCLAVLAGGFITVAAAMPSAAAATERST